MERPSPEETYNRLMVLRARQHTTWQRIATHIGITAQRMYNITSKKGVMRPEEQECILSYLEEQEPLFTDASSLKKAKARRSGFGQPTVPKEELEHLREQLEVLRTEQHLSYHDIEEETSIPRKTIARFLHGKPLSTSNARRLSHILNKAEPTLIILVEGGVVQEVVATKKGIMYRVINLDQDALSPARVYDALPEYIEDVSMYTQRQVPLLDNDERERLCSSENFAAKFTSLKRKEHSYDPSIDREPLLG